MGSSRRHNIRRPTVSSPTGSSHMVSNHMVSSLTVSSLTGSSLTVSSHMAIRDNRCRRRVTASHRWHRCLAVGLPAWGARRRAVLDTIIIAIPTVVVGALIGGFHHDNTCDGVGNCTNSYNFSTSPPIDLSHRAFDQPRLCRLFRRRQDADPRSSSGRYTRGQRRHRRADRAWPRDAASVRAGASGALCLVGYFSPFFDSTRRQGWHDKSANAVVIPAK